MIDFNKLTLADRVELAELSDALIKKGYDVSNPFKLLEYYEAFKNGDEPVLNSNK